MTQGDNIERNASTEEKIKEAAKAVFTRKGFAATRTRDIAEESGYNLALINYYFRSKENLFNIIMMEQLQAFVHSVLGIVNDPNTTLHQKLEILVSHYIDMLIKNPGLPFFLLNEVYNDPQKLLNKVGAATIAPQQLYIAKQWNEMVVANQLPPVNPIHILINVVSLTIFPFIGSPIIKNKIGLSTEQFNALMEERKRLIPTWVQAILKAS